MQSSTQPILLPPFPEDEPAPATPDWATIAGKLGRIADALEPLAVAAPVLVEWAGTYAAGKELGAAAGRGARLIERVSGWVLKVGGALAILWEASHARWDQVIKGLHP